MRFKIKNPFSRKRAGERVGKGILESLNDIGIDRNLIENVKSTLTQIQDSFDPQDVRKIFSGFSQMVSGENLTNIEDTIRGVSQLVSEENIRNLSTVFDRLKWVAPTVGVGAATGAAALLCTVVGVFAINRKLGKLVNLTGRLVGLAEEQVALLKQSISLLEQQTIELRQIQGYLAQANELVIKTNILLQNQIDFEAAEYRFREIEENFVAREFSSVIEYCNSFLKDYALIENETIRGRYLPKMYLYRGLAQLASYDTWNAISSFDESLKYDPINLNAKFFRAIAFIQLDEFDFARHDFRSIVALQRNDSLVFHLSRLFCQSLNHQPVDKEVNISVNDIDGFLERFIRNGFEISNIQSVIIDDVFIYYLLGQLYRYLSLRGIDKIPLHKNKRSSSTLVSVKTQGKGKFDSAIESLSKRVGNVSVASNMDKMRYAEIHLLAANLWLNFNKDKWRKKSVSSYLKKLQKLTLFSQGEDLYFFENILVLEGLKGAKKTQQGTFVDNLSLVRQFEYPDSYCAPLAKHFLMNSYRQEEINKAELFYRLAGLHESIPLAMYYCQRAAFLGHEEAKDIIAAFYRFDRYGRSVIVKPDRVFDWLEKDKVRDKTGRVGWEIAAAFYYTGMVYFEGGFEYEVDITQAERFFSESAALGSSYAINMLGYLYHKGCLHVDSKIHGRPQLTDLRKAEGYYERAIDLSNPLAKYNLIRLYCRDFASEEGFERARQLYDDVYDKNLVKAPLTELVELGKKRYHGRELPIDHVRALEYLQLAQIAPEEFQPTVNFYLALLYLLGRVVSKDLDQAVDYLSKPIQREHMLSQCLRYSIFKESDRRVSDRAISYDEACSDMVKSKLATNTTGQSILVFTKPGESDKNLYYRLGNSQVDSGIEWGDDFIIDFLEDEDIQKLIDFSAAITNDGFIFIVYSVINRRNKEKLYYSRGRISNGSEVIWKYLIKTQKKIFPYYDGMFPSVTINSRNQILEIHKSENYPTLYYSVAIVDSDNKLSWKRRSLVLPGGGKTAFATATFISSEKFLILRQNEKTRLLEIGISSINKAYKVDKIKEWLPIGNGKIGKITRASIARATDQKFVITYEDPEKEGYLRLVTGKVSAGRKIKLLDQDSRPYDFGANPSVIVDSQGKLVETHDLDGEMCSYISEYRL